MVNLTNFSKKVRIVSKDKIRAIGLSIKTSFFEGKQAREIPPFFHNIFENGTLEIIPGRLNKNQLCIISMEPNLQDFTYFMGVEVKMDIPIPKEFKEIFLKSNKYATLEIIKRGNADVAKNIKYLFEEWIPSSEYLATGEPVFIYYDERFSKIFKAKGYEGDPPATIFIPVKHKSK